MKKLYQTAAILLFSFVTENSFSQNICNPSGNVVIFSNYDGGKLVINVDANILNLKIGIVSYESDSVIIQGTYAGNVTAVAWAGFGSSNIHCPGESPATTVIAGTTVTPTYSVMPAAVYCPYNPNGSPTINYCTSCVSNPGSGNTADQLAAYFFSQFGSNTLLFQQTQYGCWTGTYNISAGGNCCRDCSATTGLAETSSTADFEIFPTVSNGYFTIQSSKFIIRELEIFNMIGEKVYEKDNGQLKMNNGQLSIINSPLSIDLSSSPSGIYFVKIISAEKEQIHKIVISK